MKLLKTIVFAALAATALHSQAQGYPNKAVRVIISFTAGSSTDIVARIVMNKVSELWGQPVVPENRGGAGGSIGSAVVVQPNVVTRDGKAGVQVGELVVVTEDGCERVHGAPREFFRL